MVQEYEEERLEIEKNYLLGQDILTLYDIDKSKENVLSHIRKYKIAKAKCINNMINDNVKANNLEKEKVNHTNINVNALYTINVNDKIDAEIFVKSLMAIFDMLKDTLTKVEKKYFEMCLVSNYSDNFFRDNICNGLSRNGFYPIKNSCIMKIALAFDLEVIK